MHVYAQLPMKYGVSLYKKVGFIRTKYTRFQMAYIIVNPPTPCNTPIN